MTVQKNIDIPAEVHYDANVGPEPSQQPEFPNMPQPQVNPITPEEMADLMNRFSAPPPPKGDQQLRLVILRESTFQLGALIVRCSPASRERSLALTKLEEALGWANAAILRKEKVLTANSPDGN